MVTKAVLSAHYGMREIRELYRKYFSIALMVAVTLHALAIGGIYLAQILRGSEEMVQYIRVAFVDQLLPPPPLNPSAVEALPGVKILVPPQSKDALPVPVPDVQVSADQTITTTAERDNLLDSQLGTGNSGVRTEVAPGSLDTIPPENDPDPLEFKAVQKPPVPVKEVVPEYPEIARRLNIEGSVWVNILIDKEGKPKRTLITKSENDLFNENARKAAMQMLFTPALMNNGPVPVWVTVPFRFRLNR